MFIFLKQMDNFEDYIFKLKQRHPEWFKDEQKTILEAPKPLKVEVKKPIPEAPKPVSVGLDEGDAEVVENGDAIDVVDDDEPTEWWNK